VQTHNSQIIEFANQNGDYISSIKSDCLNAERLCWSMLVEANKVIDFANGDIIEVNGKGAGAHIALLARQYPTLSFSLQNDGIENDASKILWLSYDVDINVLREYAKNCDAIVICHTPNNAKNIINELEGFARIAAKREIAQDCALSIFGRGLKRDLFKPKVRGELAA
jgi:hypothetical protein